MGRMRGSKVHFQCHKADAAANARMTIAPMLGASEKTQVKRA